MVVAGGIVSVICVSSIVCVVVASGIVSVALCRWHCVSSIVSVALCRLILQAMNAET